MALPAIAIKWRKSPWVLVLGRSLECSRKTGMGQETARPSSSGVRIRPGLIVYSDGDWVLVETWGC